ncbi:hypothetical protein [Mesorhizobium sp. M0586]|uniref:hypothetical protein n=1 Tax=unclassified Mesorhizobium TaxID=325217 RepID=UPI00333C2314
MADRKKDKLDHLIEFILDDDSPVEAEDKNYADLFDGALASGEQRLARARLDRAKAGVQASKQEGGKVLDLAGARRLLERARAGDASAQVTLAARFGDGSLDGDFDIILEGIAELEADQREED